MELAEYGAYIIIIAVVLLLIYLPRKVQERKIIKLQKDLKIGDKIVTYTGFFGTIETIDEEKAVIKIEPDNIRVMVEKWSIAKINEKK